MQHEGRTNNVLEKLMQDSREAQNGYRVAAEQISDQELRAFFTEQSLERAEFASSLQLHLQQLGSREPSPRESTAGQDGWIYVKHSSQEDRGVLEALEAGEALVRKDYAEALLEELPEDIRQLVRLQMETVVCAHDHLRLLRDRLAHGKEAA